MKKFPAQTLDQVPFPTASQFCELAARSPDRRDLCIVVYLQAAKEMSLQQVTGQIYTDKNITSSQCWQGENCPGELSNSTPALPKAPNSRQQGCFVACLVYKYNTCCSSLCQLSHAALWWVPSWVVCPQAAVFLTGDEVQPSSQSGSEYLTPQRIWADRHVLSSDDVPNSLVKLPVNSTWVNEISLYSRHRGTIMFFPNWSSIPIAWPEGVYLRVEYPLSHHTQPC